MSTCTEFAVFEVKKTHLARVLALSETLFAEINAEQENIIAHEILVKTDNVTNNQDAQVNADTEEVCWHLTWANFDAVQASKSKWSSYPSSAEIESSVGKKLYYGHFVAVVANQE